MTFRYGVSGYNGCGSSSDSRVISYRKDNRKPVVSMKNGEIQTFDLLFAKNEAYLEAGESHCTSETSISEILSVSIIPITNYTEGNIAVTIEPQGNLGLAFLDGVVKLRVDATDVRLKQETGKWEITAVVQLTDRRVLANSFYLYTATQSDHANLIGIQTQYKAGEGITISDDNTISVTPILPTTGT